jgi:hypothetical protein
MFVVSNFIGGIMERTFSDKPLSINGVWGASLRLYRKGFFKIWPLAAIMGVLVNGSIFANTFFWAKYSTVPTVGVISFVAFLILILIYVYLISVILHRTGVIGEEQNIELSASLAFVNKKYSKLILSIICGAVLCFFGMVVFVIPGIYMLLVFFMIQPLILFDNKGVFAALKNGFKLVWGNWWRTFGVFFPVLFLNCCMGVAVQFASVYSGVWYAITVGNVLSVIIFTPLLYAAVFIQFKDLKLRNTIKCNLCR